jgi:hypothetical protein
MLGGRHLAEQARVSRARRSVEDRTLDAGRVLLQVSSARTNQAANRLSEPSCVVAGLARADPNRSRPPMLNEVSVVEPNCVSLGHNPRRILGGAKICEAVGRVAADNGSNGHHRRRHDEAQGDESPFQPAHPGLPLRSLDHRLIGKSGGQEHHTDDDEGDRSGRRRERGEVEDGDLRGGESEQDEPRAPPS